MKSILTASVIILSCAVSAGAAEWPQTEIDEAVRVVAAREKNGLEECVTSGGTKIAYDVEQRDINADGVNELVVSSRPAELGNGVTSCYGRVGQNLYVVSKGGGIWQILVVGDDTHDFVFHPRDAGQMPDVELTGPGFCFPIHRFHNGEYRNWKVCDDNANLIFAEAAPWIDDKSDVAPRGDNADDVMQNVPAKQDASDDADDLVDMRSLFDHNGSDMRVDPGAGTIVYEKPKKSISGTVKPGALLFKASAPWDPYDDGVVIKGTAFVFKKGCEPAPYEVSGRQQGWHTLVLKGAAPVREKNGCKVVGYKTTGNSTLKFVSWGD